MFSQTTRLETLIVAVALLVLLLCSRPPRSGNADVYLDVEAAPDVISAPTEPPVAEEPSALPVESEAAGQAAPVEQDDSDDDPPDDVSVGEPVSTAVTRREGKRMAMVDARNCKDLDCDKIMYGEVTVRLIWNGTKLVPQKVCIVEGEDGVNTIWSFDQPPEGVIISEIEDTSTHVR